jgi:hypothetical protein
VVAALAVALSACGAGSNSETSAAGEAELISWDCSLIPGTHPPKPTSTKPFIENCTFVARDGRRFQCAQEPIAPTPSLDRAEHDKACSRLPSITIPPEKRRIIDRIDRTRNCLSSRGVHATGGPMLVHESHTTTSVGSLKTRGTTIIFYVDSGVARRLRPYFQARKQVDGTEFQAHGAVFIVWQQAPPELGTAKSCAFS